MRKYGPLMSKAKYSCSGSCRICCTKKTSPVKKIPLVKIQPYNQPHQ